MHDIQMTHSIQQARNSNPMWFFERNYVMLTSMLDETNLLQHGSAGFEIGNSLVELSVVENTRYTELIRIEQCFTTDQAWLKKISFDVRLYQDAKLAEVINYQDKARFYHKPDDMRQGNLLLHDWLSMCTRLNYQETIIENCRS